MDQFTSKVSILLTVTNVLAFWLIFLKTVCWNVPNPWKPKADLSQSRMFISTLLISKKREVAFTLKNFNLENLQFICNYLHASNIQTTSRITRNKLLGNHIFFEVCWSGMLKGQNLNGCFMHFNASLSQWKKNSFYLSCIVVGEMINFCSIWYD